MAKFLGATSLVALALLGCLVGTEVEAQTYQGWMPPFTKPQTPQNRQNPQPHLPPPTNRQQPGYPTNPQPPQQPWKPSPQSPNYPPQQPGYPTNPQPPQQPGYPTNPQPPQQPGYPSNPQPPQQPGYPSNPQPPQQPGYPSNPQPPQQPGYPSNPQPPQQPGYPSNPQPPQHPGYPSNPQPPQQPWKPTNPQPPQQPGYPTNPQPPQHPGYPTNPQPPQQPWKPTNSQPPNPPSHHQKGSPFLGADQASQNPQFPKQQKPVTPQKTHVLPPTKPGYPAPRDCNVDLSVRIPCGHRAISASECEALNCCFEGNNCYFGKAVTVGCTKNGLFIVVAAKDATQPNIDLDAISLLEQGPQCAHVDSNSQFAIFQFPVTACGSVVMEEPGVIIYENRLTSSYEVGVGPRGAITRDSTYELLFQCRYIGTSVQTLVVEVLPLENPPLPVAARGPISVQLRLANGQCSTKGCNEVDAAYSSFYVEADYPVNKVLRDPVYVDVQLLGKTDPLLVLTLDRCWATTSPEPHSLPQWDILIGGCPYRDDRYLSSLVHVDQSSGLEFPNHHKRFSFKMFTFVNPTSMEPLRELVYIHCSTAVCYAAPGARCQQACLYRKRRDTAAVSQEKSEPKIVVSSGPVSMVSPQQ